MTPHRKKYGYDRHHNPNLFCPGQRIPSQEFKDNHEATFHPMCKGCPEYSTVIGKCFYKKGCVKAGRGEGEDEHDR
ncbi:MAG: hypothetical protein ACXABY_18570 [Candidatus Thorarchaeota archaeon]